MFTLEDTDTGCQNYNNFRLNECVFSPSNKKGCCSTEKQNVALIYLKIKKRICVYDVDF